MKKKEEVKLKKAMNRRLMIGYVVIGVVALFAIVYFVVSSFNKIAYYEFDFNDGFIPGMTYKGELNLKTGEVKLTKHYGCSLPDPNDCTDPETKEGTISEENLSKIDEKLSEIDYAESGRIICSISYLIDGDYKDFDEAYSNCSVIFEN